MAGPIKVRSTIDGCNVDDSNLLPSFREEIIDQATIRKWITDNYATLVHGLEQSGAVGEFEFKHASNFHRLQVLRLLAIGAEFIRVYPALQDDGTHIFLIVGTDADGKVLLPTEGDGVIRHGVELECCGRPPGTKRGEPQPPLDRKFNNDPFLPAPYKPTA